jgi:hypothetical protein
MIAVKVWFEIDYLYDCTYLNSSQGKDHIFKFVYLSLDLIDVLLQAGRRNSCRTFDYKVMIL